MRLKNCFNFLPLLFTFVVIFGFHHSGLIALKFYPPVVNFVFFLIFFTSLFSKETIIQKVARMMDGKELCEKVSNYTRNLTYIWTIFLLLNFLVSLSTVFSSEKIWAIYNGLISYMLIGLFFTIEYIVRLQFRKKHNV